MSGLIESAAAILGASERRLEAVASNVANVSTPGYKRQVSFAAMVRDATDPAGRMAIRTRADFSVGKLADTGNPLDLAIGGGGFFQLRAGDDLVYSRQGNFTLAADGTVITPQGYVLQQAGGGDLTLDSADVQIQPDGTVVANGQPVAKVGVFVADDARKAQPIDGSLFRFDAGAMHDAADPQLHQGTTEASNVTVGDEMVTMMDALRQAESGAHIVQAYDDLVGKAISTFGGGQ